MAITQIKLIHSKERKEFRITVNGKDVYTPFPYNTPLMMKEVQTMAKAFAFDEACRETIGLNRADKIFVSFDVF